MVSSVCDVHSNTADNISWFIPGLVELCFLQSPLKCHSLAELFLDARRNRG